MKKMNWHYYNLYGLTLRSEIPFPELGGVETEKPNGRPRVTFDIGCRDGRWDGKGERFQGLSYSWKKDGRAAKVYSHEVGTFHVWIPQRHITWHPIPSSSHDLARVILKGKILGLLLSRLHSRLVLHANVLSIKGKGVAFCGAIQAGKSTLASYLIKKGALLHSDDTAVLRYQKGSFWAEAGPPEIRLWPKSGFLLHSLGLKSESLYPQTIKKRFLLSQRHSRAASGRPLRIHSIYLLERGESGGVNVDKLNKQKALAEILRNIYLPLTQNPAILLRQFPLAVKAVSLISVKRLSFPSSYTRLPDVTEAVRDDLKRNLK